MIERPYQRLIVWKEAHALCLRTYRVTKEFPPEERYGLKSQMRSSSSSVPTNIAEGSRKSHPKERGQFYERAHCSLEELHYQYLLSCELGYIAQEEFKEVDGHIQRVSYLLMKLRNAIK